MPEFHAEQKLVRVGKVTLGGRIGEYPTALVGSLFFRGHRIVSDPERGLFDAAAARELLDREAAWSQWSGNPRIIDVIGETREALIRYLEFVADHTDAPMLVDSPDPGVRMAILRRFAGSETASRLIYNSIAEDFTEEELACIRESGVKTAVVLAFSPRAMKPQGVLALLREKLLPAAQRAGVEQVLVDVGVLGVAGVGWAARSIWEVKNALGLPAGCAPANSLYQWGIREKGALPFAAAGSAVLGLPLCCGADFLLYGSLANAPWVYPACASTDALLAYQARLDRVQPRTDDHPLFRIMHD